MTHTVVITLGIPRRTCRRCSRIRAPVPVHRPTLAAQRQGFRAPGLMPVRRRVRPERVGAGLVHPRTRNHHYWNDARHPSGRGEVSSDHRDENAELTRYRADELDVTAVVPRGQFDWIHAPRRSAACGPAADHLLLRLQSEPRALQGRASCAARSRLVDRPREARAARAPGRASCPPTAGYRLASPTTPRQSFDYRGEPMATRIAKRSALHARPATRARSRCASSCATTRARCTRSSRSRSPPCGRRRSAPR